MADFDEFLYCPVAGPTASQQAIYVANYMDTYRAQSFDQITIPQRYVANLTESPRDCVIEQVRVNSSVLNCFGPYEFYMGGHSIKSIHLGHKCPLTGYHQSCPTGNSDFLYHFLRIHFFIYNCRGSATIL